MLSFLFAQMLIRTKNWCQYQRVESKQEKEYSFDFDVEFSDEEVSIRSIRKP